MSEHLRKMMVPARPGGYRRLTFDNGRYEDYQAVFVQHSGGEWDRILIARDDGSIARLIADLINGAPASQSMLGECGFNEPHEAHEYVVADDGRPADRHCPGLAEDNRQSRLFEAVRRVIRDGIDSPGAYDELHLAFYAVRDESFDGR